MLGTFVNEKHFQNSAVRLRVERQWRWRGLCGTPDVWAAEQRQAAESALADKAQSYDGKFYSGDDAKGVMAEWRDGAEKQ